MFRCPANASGSEGQREAIAKLAVRHRDKWSENKKPIRAFICVNDHVLIQD